MDHLPKMKPKAKYKERVELTDIESTIKILIQGELQSIPKRTVNKWFKQSYAYLLSLEDYKRLSLIRDAEINYKNN